MKLLPLILMLLLPAAAGALDAPAYRSGPYAGLLKTLLKDCTGDRKIAVADFAYQDGRASGDGGAVSERLTTELVKMKRFRVAERREMKAVLAELKLQSSGAMDPGSIKSMGKMLGADWLILGTLTELPRGRIEVNARLVGVESGEILNAASAKIKKDWSDRPAEGAEPEDGFRKTDELDEYGKAIRKFMDKKAEEDKHVIKEPPPSFQ